MGQSRTWFGVILTFGYLAWSCSIIAPKYGKIYELPLNELGDFFAGICGPLAFLWLVLGYFQQGAELRLQAEELSKSVEHQKELAEATRRQVEHQASELELARERENAAYKANFAFEARFRMSSGDGVESLVKITNLGGDALAINLIFSPGIGSLNLHQIGLLRRDGATEFKVLLPGAAGTTKHQLVVTYSDLRRLQYQVLYYFDVEVGRISDFKLIAHTIGVESHG